MQISRKSWHYKLRTFTDTLEKRNDNLCSYFWTCVFKAVVSLTFIMAAGTFGYIFFTSPQWISTSILILLLIFSVVLPALTIVFIRKKLGHPPRIPKENLLFEYLKAKKDKVCPLIEYVD